MRNRTKIATLLALLTQMYRGRAAAGRRGDAARDARFAVLVVVGMVLPLGLCMLSLLQREPSDFKSHALSAGPPPVTTKAPIRNFSECDALFGPSAQLRGRERDTEWSKWSDTQVEVSGTVEEVGEALPSGLNLLVQHSPATFDIVVRLRSDQIDSSRELRKGSRVRFVARLVTLAPPAYGFDDGVLLEAQ